jgi:hypothetical protein
MAIENLVASTLDDRRRETGMKTCRPAPGISPIWNFTDLEFHR